MPDENNLANNQFIENEVKEIDSQNDIASNSTEVRQNTPPSVGNNDNNNPAVVNIGESSIKVPVQVMPDNISDVVSDINKELNNSSINGNGSKSTVVVARGDGLPKWFYLVFLLTFVGFLGMSFILYNMFTKNNAKIPNAVNGFPVPTISEINSVTTPTLTIVQDGNGLAKEIFGNLTRSDDLKDIETDLRKTDFSPIDESIENLDKQLN